MRIIFSNRIVSTIACFCLVLFLTITPLSITFTSGISHNFVEATTTTATSDPGPNALDRMGLMVGSFILGITALLTGIGGLLLDLSIKHLVLGMGKYLTEGGIGIVINQIWTIVRDLGNIVFIFGFIYIGISNIISPNSSRLKGFLAQLIIAALLINFSLFFTKIVIDIANVFAIEINSLMTSNGGGNIGTAFANAMGISSWYGNISPAQLATMTSGGTAAFFFAGAIFLLIAAFVLAAAAIMIIVRFVMLIFIMIGSPILFAGIVFPQTKKYSDMILQNLLRYAFFAPIMLFCIYISLRVLKATTFKIEGGGFSDLVTASESTQLDQWGILLQYTIAVLFLLGSLKIAKEFSIQGASGVIKFGSNLGRGIVGGVTGFAGRNTLGRWGEAVAKRTEEDRKSTKPGTRLMAGLSRVSGVEGMAKGLQNNKFGSSSSRADVVKGTKEVKRGITQNQLNEKLGDAIEKGVSKSARPDDRIAMERAIAGASNAQILELVKDTKDKDKYETIVGAMSASQFESLMKEKDEEFDAGKKAKLAEARGKAVEKSINNTKKVATETFTQVIKNASASQLEVLGAKKLEEHAVGLTPSQMDDLKKKLTETEFRNLSTKREKALEEVATGTNKNGIVKATLLGQKPGDMAKLPGSVLKKLATDLPVQTLNKIVQDGSLSRGDQKDIRDAIEAAFRATATPTQEQIDRKDWLDTNNIGKTFGK